MLRLSSDDYGSCDFTDADIVEIDRIENTLSQYQRNLEEDKRKRKAELNALSTAEKKKRRFRNIVEGLRDAAYYAAHRYEREYAHIRRPRSPPSSLEEPPPVSEPSNTQEKEPTPSPEEPPGQEDYSDFFDSADVSVLPGFAKASVTLSATQERQNTEDTSVKEIGKQRITSSISKDNELLPSKEALELAEKKMKQWVDEEEKVTDIPPEEPDSPALISPASDSLPSALPSSRPPLSPARINSEQILATPVRKSPLVLKGQRAFKSPLIGSATTGKLYPRAPPERKLHPLASTPINASQLSQFASSASPKFATPIRATNLAAGGSTRPTPKSGFVTPFKPGMRPGEPGRALLEQKKEIVKTSKVSKSKTGKLSSPRKRSLKDSGLRPQTYTEEELEAMGVNIVDLKQITVETAFFYLFHHVKWGEPVPKGLPLHGARIACDRLHSGGRHRATYDWVENHWCLILWKLAGLVCLEPQREQTVHRRWCWTEVMRQLQSRYDLEFVRGVRTPLRMIATGDASPSSPMVLLVSNIFMKPDISTPKGHIIKGHPEIEVSDGWYRLKATIDLALARAVRKGIITIGKKIAVSRAKLDSNRKEPMEILQGYRHLRLVLSANSSHLAPWHAKLGFLKSQPIATLHKLVPDGGMVTFMDLVVVKVHELGFFEWKEDENGEQQQIGPYLEEEEEKYKEEWLRRREREEIAVREELETRWGKWDALAERLEYISQPFDPEVYETATKCYDDLVEDMVDMTPEEATKELKLRRVNSWDSGFIARDVRAQVKRERYRAASDVQSQVEARCPPRNVKTFRVLIVRDARTCRRSAFRRAQLNVWDVTSKFESSTGKPGVVEVGQRFLVTDLLPTNPSSWMEPVSEGAEVFLRTTGSSKIQLIS